MLEKLSSECPVHYSLRIFIFPSLLGLLYQGLEGSDILRQAIDLAHDLLLLGLRVVLDLLLELGDLSFDSRASTCWSVRGQPEDVALALEQLFDLLQPEVILHDAAELLEGRLIHDLVDAREGVTHDGNEQVHEDKLDNERSENEHDPDSPCVLHWVVVLTELTKTSQVGVDQGIDWRDTDKWLVDGAALLTVTTSILETVQVEDEDDVGEGHQGNDQHDHEDLDVLDDLRNHANERTERLEEAHPVEQLEPEQEGRHRSDELQVLVADEVRDLAVDVERVQDKREHIYQVPKVKEVGKAAVSDLDQLQDHEGDERLTQDDQTDDLRDELWPELVILVVREVARVENKRGKVEDER